MGDLGPLGPQAAEEVSTIVAGDKSSTEPGKAKGRKSKKRDADGGRKKPRFDYPRTGKGPIHRWLPSWRVVLGTVVTLIAVGIGLFIAAYVTTDIPEPGDFAQAEGSNVYFADDETQMGSFAEYNREIVEMSTLPEHIGHAVVASEDRRFYENVGVDPIAIGRALWNNVRGNPTQGGSTLTQQYVERYYLGTTTNIPGKVREAILALKIDREQSKDEILGDYLNTIYFGRNAYGIETAAQNYFGKPAAELTLSESALLAGIIPAPSAWDPAENPERAEQRWARTLDFMVSDGWITQAEADEQTFPETVEYSRSDTYAGPTGYLLDMVRTELVDEAGLTAEQIDTLGLRVRTTIDADAQASAVDVVDSLPEDRPENNRVAIVSLDPADGSVVALYGGADFLTTSRNAATQDVAQAGSTFKPFTLVAALEDGYGLGTGYSSYTPMVIDGFEEPVNNYDLVNRGWIDLVTATQHSVNTVYAQLNVDVGPERAMEVAVDAGYPEDTPGLAPVPSNVLGPASPHPIDVARAYATFAAEGVRHETHIVDEVLDSDGNVVYSGGSPGRRVIEEDVMAEATYAMSQVINGGTGVRALDLGRPAAGKTGTSNDARSAWFAGYTPQLTTVVAMYQVGEDGGEETLTPFGEYDSITGSTYPTTMWRDFMAEVLADEPIEDFPERTYIQQAPPAQPVEPAPPPAPEPEPEPPAPEPEPEPTTEPEPEPTTEPDPEPEPTTEPDPEPTQPPDEPEPEPTQPADEEEADARPGGRPDGESGQQDSRASRSENRGDNRDGRNGAANRPGRGSG